MYDELVKQCRDCIDCLCGECKYEHLQKPGNFVQCMNALLGDAADAIEELSKAPTLEDLQAEAEKLGYRLVKRRKYVRILPYTCGCRYHTKWYFSNGDIFYTCTKCGLKGPAGENDRDAKEKWNQMIYNQMIELLKEEREEES